MRLIAASVAEIPMDNKKEQRHSWRLPLTCGQQSAEVSSEENTGRNMDKGNREKQTPRQYVPSNNSPLDKNPMSELGIKPETHLLVDK